MMFIFAQANRTLLNAQYRHLSYTDENLSYLGNRVSKKYRPFNYNLKKEAVSPSGRSENLSGLETRFSKEPRQFNYNPEKEAVSAFVAKVLAELFSAEKMKEFEMLSRKMEDLEAEREQIQQEVKKNEYGERIKDLRNELTEKKQVREKIKFSFEGFDILKNAIPAELFARTKDIATNDILVILRKGYLTSQVNALFNLSQADMEELSKKGKNRKRKEDIIYVNVIELMSKILEFIDVCRAEAVVSSKKKILKDIKKLGNEGKKMYKLLRPLLKLNSNPSEFSFESS